MLSYLRLVCTRGGGHRREKSGFRFLQDIRSPKRRRFSVSRRFRTCRLLTHTACVDPTGTAFTATWSPPRSHFGNICIRRAWRSAGISRVWTLKFVSFYLRCRNEPSPNGINSGKIDETIVLFIVFRLFFFTPSSVLIAEWGEIASLVNIKPVRKNFRSTYPTVYAGCILGKQPLRDSSIRISDRTNKVDL